jgi:hypothetical protein
MKFLGFFILGLIAYGLNLLIKYILNKNGIKMTYMNTFLIEYIEFFKLIKKSSDNKYLYILIFFLSILFYILSILYLFWIFR